MILKVSFINDKEKMRDFFRLSKRDFLNSYSYLSEQEYNATFIDVYKRILKINTHKLIESTTRDIMFTKDNIKIYDEAFIDVDIDNRGRVKMVNDFEPEYSPDEIAQALCNLAHDNPSKALIFECESAVNQVLKVVQNPYSADYNRTFYHLLEQITDIHK